MRFRAICVALALAALPACSAGDGSESDGRLRVVAAFYPLEYAVARVGGSDVDVDGLTRPGTEPHDLELTPRQAAAIGDADLVVHLAGLQPAVDDAVAQQAPDASLDVAAVQPLERGYVAIEEGELHEDAGGVDPHFWLDPTRYARVVDAIAERLAAVDADGADGYRSRAAELVAELASLDRDLAAGLRTCARRELVTSHNAFGYLARAYDLEQVGITGLTPEDEPTPARLAQVVELARKRRVTTVFFEELVSPKVAEALAAEIGARAEVLTPLESAPESGGYFDAMRSNLAALRTALGCS